METQIVRKDEVKVRASIHIHGTPELRIGFDTGWVALEIGDADIYFDNSQQFKAFVGEMIKAVANLR